MDRSKVGCEFASVSRVVIDGSTAVDTKGNILNNA